MIELSGFALAVIVGCVGGVAFATGFCVAIRIATNDIQRLMDKTEIVTNKLKLRIAELGGDTRRYVGEEMVGPFDIGWTSQEHIDAGIKIMQEVQARDEAAL